MPGRYGTGSKTGRGLGLCSEIDKYGSGMGTDLGLGLARRRGLGRSFGRGVAINSKSLESPEAQKELLENKRDVLKNRLQAIDEQLKSL